MFILILGSILALIASYFLEYVLHLAPCSLCIYQRYIFFLILASSVIVQIFARRSNIAVAFVLLLVISNMFLAGFHFGVEKHFWKYESSCTSSASKKDSFDDYKSKLFNRNLVSCSETQFTYLNISLSGWNFIYSLFLIAAYIRQKYIFKRAT